jgi:uncharacterized protein
VLKLALLFFLIQAISWGSEIQIPVLRAPVMDEAALLNESEEADLNQVAYEIHTHQGPQVTILTLNDLQGLEIEDFSIRVVEKWQLGTKEKDNGLLILISKAERKMRIEVGNGIEGEITDYEANQYINQILKPAFRQGQYHAGLRLILQDVAKKFNLKLEQERGFIRRSARPQMKIQIPEGLRKAFPFILILFIGAQIILRNSPRARGVVSGLTFSGVGFFLGAGLVLYLALFILGTVLGLIGLHNVLYALLEANSPHHRGGYGSYSGGGSSGRGWSGGGGGFSGGGSSGDW